MENNQLDKHVLLAELESVLLVTESGEKLLPAIQEILKSSPETLIEADRVIPNPTIDSHDELSYAIATGLVCFRKKIGRSATSDERNSFIDWCKKFKDPTRVPIMLDAIPSSMTLSGFIEKVFQNLEQEFDMKAWDAAVKKVSGNTNLPALLEFVGTAKEIQHPNSTSQTQCTWVETKTSPDDERVSSLSSSLSAPPKGHSFWEGTEGTHKDRTRDPTFVSGP